MSFQRVYRNKKSNKPPKIEPILEPVLQQVPENSADRFSSAAIKNQNFFIEEEDLSHTKQNSTNTKTIVQQEQTITSQLLPEHQSPATELLTENGKDDAPLSSDIRLKEDEDHAVENYTSPTNKRLTKLDLLRRQDSIPVVVSGFHQIESNFDDDRNGSKNDDDNWSYSPEKTNGFIISSNTHFVHSKFAPDHLKKNNSQALKSPIHNISLSNRGDLRSIE